MGDTICRSDRRAINLEFHSLGKGQHKMWEYVTAKLEKPLQVAASKKGIKLSEIEQVNYKSFPVDRNKTLEELEIENGGIILIKTKVTF